MLLIFEDNLSTDFDEEIEFLKKVNIKEFKKYEQNQEIKNKGSNFIKNKEALFYLSYWQSIMIFKKLINFKIY